MENDNPVIAEIRTLAEAVCNGSITPRQCERLNALLPTDEEAAMAYAVYIRMHGLLSWHWQDQSTPAIQNVAPPAAAVSGGRWPSAFGFLSQTAPFSYMVATVVLCLMLLGAWAYTINHNHNAYVDNSRRSTTSGQSELFFVGRITGMKDCRWSDTDTQTVVGAAVPLDRKYALASGLLEITYKTGAKVIIEGPCTYKVESSAGGYLDRGKLTANIRGRKSEHSPPSSLPPPLFSVRTPTAVITDLGTEFGVEVNENGDTTSYVFQGAVRVEASALGGTGSASGARGVVLRKKESVLVTKDAAKRVRFTHLTTPPKFVRRMVEPLKLLDLLDIVAGGNGANGRRGRGISATDGRITNKYVGGHRRGNGQYHPVFTRLMIDGVFVPDGNSGPVQLDSAGHSFDGFPETLGLTWGSIWAQAVKNEPEKYVTAWIHSITDLEPFTPKSRGLLAFHPNAGLTFDLEAIRKRYPGTRLKGFHAVAGLASSSLLLPRVDGRVDLWIFVDGRLKYKRIGLNRKNGPIDIDVELTDTDHFLTLASTDGGDGGSADWLVFGDPVLRMSDAME